MTGESFVDRRKFIASLTALAVALPAITAARQAIAAVGLNPGRLGICTFSCHRSFWFAPLRDLEVTG